MEEDDEQYEPLPATPMQGLDLVILSTEAVGAFFRLTGSIFSDLTHILCRHANYKVELKRMENEARLELEMLVNGK